jgi:hypothetical protein
MPNAAGVAAAARDAEADAREAYETARDDATSANRRGDADAGPHGANASG